MPPMVIPLQISVDRYYLKDVMKAILHTILFHRTLSSIKPGSGTIGPLDLDFCKVDDLSIDSNIDTQVNEIIQVVDGVQTGKPPQSLIHVVVVFYDKRRGNSPGWFPSKLIEEGSWEEWVITISITRAATEKEQIQSKLQLQKNLESLLVQISHEAGTKREHIPAIVDADPFPYQISHTLPQQGSNWSKAISNIIPF
jgi:autophagy-related protein 101